MITFAPLQTLQTRQDRGISISLLSRIQSKLKRRVEKCLVLFLSVSAPAPTFCFRIYRFIIVGPVKRVSLSCRGCSPKVRHYSISCQASFLLFTSVYGYLYTCIPIRPSHLVSNNSLYTPLNHPHPLCI